MGKRLTDEQRKFYDENGYLIGLPAVYSPAEVRALNEGLSELMKLLRPGEDAKDIREWHESSRFLYNICTNNTILDYVEDVLGPDFYLWGSNFFIKPPRSSSTVGWHQDTYYWPLEPKISATVWPISLSVPRTPRFTPARTLGPETSSGTYSRLWSVDGVVGSQPWSAVNTVRSPSPRRLSNSGTHASNSSRAAP